jgi:GTP-sensing pleiotropic transcriptional regulator CodY
MKLDIRERILLMQLLPEKGSYILYRNMECLKKELSFSEEELESAGIKNVDGRVNWNPEKDPLKDVEIGESMRDIIVNALKKLDEDGQIDSQNISLYEKFIVQ